jgi:hypothetical protein
VFHNFHGFFYLSYCSPFGSFIAVLGTGGTIQMQKELSEIAKATAADVGYEAIRWWIDEAKPNRLRVQARPISTLSSVTIILIAILPEAASCE